MLRIADILGEDDLQVRQDIDSVAPSSCEEEVEKTQEETKNRKSRPVGNIFVQNLALTGQMNQARGRHQVFKNSFFITRKKEHY